MSRNTYTLIRRRSLQNNTYLTQSGSNRWGVSIASGVMRASSISCRFCDGDRGHCVKAVCMIRISTHQRRMERGSHQKEFFPLSQIHTHDSTHLVGTGHGQPRLQPGVRARIRIRTQALQALPPHVRHWLLLLLRLPLSNWGWG